MTTLTPTGGGRRSATPVVLAVLVALAIGAVGGWYWAGRDTSNNASPGPSSSCSSATGTATGRATGRPTGTASPKTTASPKAVVLPNPRQIRVNVYNATKRSGLARATSVELASRAFAIGAVANDPLKKTVAATAEIRYGPAGANGAKVVAAQVPNPVLVVDARRDTSVDLVIGEGFSALNTPAQAALLLKPSPSPTASPC
jgi:hypothetical protein